VSNSELVLFSGMKPQELVPGRALSPGELNGRADAMGMANTSIPKAEIRGNPGYSSRQNQRSCRRRSRDGRSGF